MSRENVEVVRRVFDALARRDTATVLTLYDPEVDLDTTRLRLSDLIGRGIYRGHEGLRRWFAEWYEAWENVERNVEELIDAGVQVISVITVRGRGRASGAEVEWKDVAVLWTVRDAKVVRLVWFPSREEALDATGLPE